MSEIKVSIDVPADLRRKLADLLGAQRTVTEGAAMGIENALRDHFAKLQRRPRRDGFRHTGFWSGADGNSVAEQITGHVVHDDARASVTIESAPLIHKLAGGTIRAEDHGKTYLTIPATDAAAQAPQGARSFAAHIKWARHPDGGVRPALVAGERPQRENGRRRTRGKGAGAAPQVLFWLVKAVTHQPQPDALPDDRTLGDAAREGALDALEVLLRMQAT
ncbi:MAG TPA: hypothetical protein PLY53_15750 [Planctomycetota bacterium]|nr:hypothetical protein [Planctomycetota bacterium]